MADVRQLLRAERASRRLTHPHASYTKDNKLLCNLCETLVKSESQWQAHLHSTQHLLRSQRAKDIGDIGNAGGARKRKAESPSLEEAADERKRVRPSEIADVQDASSRPSKSTKLVSEAVLEDQAAQREVLPRGDVPAVSSVDEAELAALERDLADLEQDTALTGGSDVAPGSALNAEATISAAPVSAAELAAQGTQEKSTQRGRRDAELEDEREDAARLLEDELDEMEGLEARVRQLRERREALRKSADDHEVANHDNGESGTEALRVGADLEKNNDGNYDYDDDDDADDDDDGWNFGAR